MTTEPTAPDAALLWARENAVGGGASEGLKREVIGGKWDYLSAVTMRAEAFRAGQAHADAGLLEALEECVTVLTADTIGTYNQDDPDWYAAIDRAVPRARAAIAAAKGADQ
jgi:hypothetical protein